MNTSLDAEASRRSRCSSHGSTANMSLLPQLGDALQPFCISSAAIESVVQALELLLEASPLVECLL